MKSIVLSLFILFSSIASATPILWGDNGHYYEYISSPENEFDARQQALDSTFMGMSGYLVTITSQSEQDFVNSLFANIGVVSAWIGLTDTQTEGTWLWMDGPEAGLEAIYNNWAPGEPNNCCSGGEDYVAMNWGTLGKWNDWGSPTFTNVNIGYVVEYSSDSSASVPEPSTIGLFGLALIALRRLKKS